MPRVEAWFLGTWHAALLVLAVVLGLLAAGAVGVLFDVGPAQGLALFGLLWAVSVWTAHRVLLVGPDQVLAAAAAYGMLAASIVVVVVQAVLIAAFSIRAGTFEPTGLIFALFVLAFSWVPGALIGVVLAIVDRGLLAGLVDPPSPMPALP